MSVHLPKFGRFIACSLKVRDAQVAEHLKHGGLTLATDGDGNRHDPTKEPYSYLHEVEVREVLFHASNVIFAPPAVLAISGLTPHKPRMVWLHSQYRAKQSAECVYVLLDQSHMKLLRQVLHGTPVKRFGFERHGSSGNPTLPGKSFTNRVNLKISNRLAWCKDHRVGHGNRYLLYDLRAEGRCGGTCVRVRRAPRVISTLLGKCSTTDL